MAGRPAPLSAARPSRSWRDYLTDDGELRPEAAARLEREETGVQRGRALTG